MIYKLNYSIANAFFKVPKVFDFMNRNCKKSCYPILLKIYESLPKKFENLEVFKRLNITQKKTGRPAQLGNMSRIGDFGPGGRYEVYMGQANG